MPFTFTECFDTNGVLFEGLFEVQPRVFDDARGYFFEVYNKKDFAASGLDMDFVQDNQSCSAKGVLRGLHFQTQKPQGKLVRAVFGLVYDAVVDLRSGSKTFGKYYGAMLDGKKNNQLYIPKGFAHGFCAVTDAVFAYKCSDFYDPAGECGIKWNDETIGVNWAIALKNTSPILSQKDMLHPCFDSNAVYFDRNGHWIGGAKS